MIRHKDAAEIRNESMSATKGAPRPTAWNSNVPSGGPAICAAPKAASFCAAADYYGRSVKALRQRLPQPRLAFHALPAHRVCQHRLAIAERAGEDADVDGAQRLLIELSSYLDSVEVAI